MNSDTRFQDYTKAAIVGIGLIAASVLVFSLIKYYFEYVYQPTSFTQELVSENPSPANVRGLSIAPAPERLQIPDLQPSTDSHTFVTVDDANYVEVFDISAPDKPLMRLPSESIQKVIPLQQSDPITITTRSVYWGQRQLWSSIVSQIDDVYLSAQGELFMLVNGQELILISNSLHQQSVYKFAQELTQPRILAVDNTGTKLEILDSGLCIQLNLDTRTTDEQQCTQNQLAADLATSFEKKTQVSLVSWQGENFSIPGFEVVQAKHVDGYIFVQAVNVDDQSVRLLRINVATAQLSEVDLPINGVIEQIGVDESDLYVVINTGRAQLIYKYFLHIQPTSYVSKWSNITADLCASQQCSINIVNYP